jgi:hypothetical protein
MSKSTCAAEYKVRRGVNLYISLARMLLVSPLSLTLLLLHVAPLPSPTAAGTVVCTQFTSVFQHNLQKREGSAVLLVNVMYLHGKTIKSLT